MKSRYHMDNGRYMVEEDRTKEGLKWMQNFRANNSKFKGRRIKSVIQAYPSKVNTRKIYEMG